MFSKSFLLEEELLREGGIFLRVSATAGAVGTPDQSPKAHNFTRVFSEEDKSSDEIKNNVGRQQHKVLATTK